MSNRPHKGWPRSTLDSGSPRRTMVLRHPPTREYQSDRASRTASRTATHPADHTTPPQPDPRKRQIHQPPLDKRLSISGVSSRTQPWSPPWSRPAFDVARASSRRRRQSRHGRNSGRVRPGAECRFDRPMKVGSFPHGCRVAKGPPDQSAQPEANRRAKGPIRQALRAALRAPLSLHPRLGFPCGAARAAHPGRSRIPDGQRRSSRATRTVGGRRPQESW